MPDLSARNKSFIKSKYPEIYEALSDHESAINNLGTQTNASPVGQTPAPQSHSAISVKGGGGILDVALTDNSPQFRGKSNFIEYADNPSFTGAHVVDLGASRNWRQNIGTGTFHVRSYTAHQTSGPSEKLYHAPVSTSGSAQPPMQPSQGSGTSSLPGQGFGESQFNTPKAPIR